MEMFELRYFLAAAGLENVQRAGEALGVSPGSISKAIKRLEAELGVALFARVGRVVRLNEHGRMLQKRASVILQLEEAARLEIVGKDASLQATVSGPEALLARFGPEVGDEIRRAHPAAAFEYRAADEQGAQELVERGEAHLALVTSDPAPGLASRALAEVTFRCFAGPGHPLHAAARAGRTLAVERVLEHAFVAPSDGMLGQVGPRQSLDGWRDDKFARRIRFRTTSLRTLEALVGAGAALAYLPDYLPREGSGLVALKISGCPYSCRQTVRLVARDPKRVGWINRLF